MAHLFLLYHRSFCHKSKPPHPLILIVEISVSYVTGFVMQIMKEVNPHYPLHTLSLHSVSICGVSSSYSSSYATC